jgi:hypothetical protein
MNYNNMLSSRTATSKKSDVDLEGILKYRGYPPDSTSRRQFSENR